MNRFYWLAAVAALGLVGCSKQQQAEANNQAAKAKVQTQNALQSAKQTLTDASITAKVKTDLGSSDKLDTSNINVDTKNRVTYLKGSVPDAKQKSIADQIAKDVVGNDVKVVDQLQIRPSNAKK